MCGDPRRAAPAPIWRDDINAIARVVEDAVEIRGRAMGQNRSGTTGEHGREQMSLSGKEAVTNGVNALLNTVESSRVSSLPCQVSIQIRELPESNQTVLTIRQISQLAIKIRPPSTPTGRKAVR